MKVDMSPKAVKGRLKLISNLRRLSVSLGKAKKETELKRNNKKISRTENLDEKVLQQV